MIPNEERTANALERIADALEILAGTDRSKLINPFDER